MATLGSFPFPTNTSDTSFAAWQASGRDQHGQPLCLTFRFLLCTIFCTRITCCIDPLSNRAGVVADPEFAGAQGGGDWSHLQPSSPALQRGFQPIDTSTVGPRPPQFADSRHQSLGKNMERSILLKRAGFRLASLNATQMAELRWRALDAAGAAEHSKQMGLR